MNGFTLLEVLISLFILSILLLGLDAMQLAALREAESAYYLSVATQQLNNMLERLQITKNDSLSDQQQQWNQQNQMVLPNGRGVISGEYPHIKLAIYWGDESAGACEKDKIGQSGCLQLAL